MNERFYESQNIFFKREFLGLLLTLLLHSHEDHQPGSSHGLTGLAGLTGLTGLAGLADRAYSPNLLLSKNFRSLH